MKGSFECQYLYSIKILLIHIVWQMLMEIAIGHDVLILGNTYVIMEERDLESKILGCH